MSFEMTVGLLVIDHQKYAQYRAEIAPLLEKAGGRFLYDFEVWRTLRSEAPHEINRVFVLRFPDRAQKEQFFSNANMPKSVPACSSRRWMERPFLPRLLPRR